MSTTTFHFSVLSSRLDERVQCSGRTLSPEFCTFGRQFSDDLKFRETRPLNKTRKTRCRATIVTGGIYGRHICRQCSNAETIYCDQGWLLVLSDAALTTHRARGWSARIHSDDFPAVQFERRPITRQGALIRHVAAAGGISARQ